MIVYVLALLTVFLLILWVIARVLSYFCELKESYDESEASEEPDETSEPMPNYRHLPPPRWDTPRVAYRCTVTSEVLISKSIPSQSIIFPYSIVSASSSREDCPDNDGYTGLWA